MYQLFMCRNEVLQLDRQTPTISQTLMGPQHSKYECFPKLTSPNWKSKVQFPASILLGCDTVSKGCLGPLNPSR